MARCVTGPSRWASCGGLQDPVATTNVLDGLRELRPGAEVIELPGVGHYPQVEVPDAFARGALRLLDAAPSRGTW